jgi:hypothetical protein
MRNLIYLQERSISTRMDFRQIRQLSYKQFQLGLTSKIINVPIDLDRAQITLPRYFSNSIKIAVMLKNKLEPKLHTCLEMYEQEIVLFLLMICATLHFTKMKVLSLIMKWKEF